MDKNTITGTVLIALLIIGYYYFTQPSEEERAQMMRHQDSLREVYEEQRRANEDYEQQKQDEAQFSEDSFDRKSDSVNVQKLQQQYGRYADAAEGEEQFDVLENNLITARFSNKGGKLYEVNLKEYKTYNEYVSDDDSDTVHGVNLLGEDVEFGLLLSEIGMSTDDLYFTRVDRKTASVPQNSIVYRLYADEFSYIEFVYTLPEDSYVVDMNMNMVNMSQHIRDLMYNLHWEATLSVTEKTKDAENMYTNAVWKYYDDDVETSSPSVDSEETEELSGRVAWLAFKQHFFSTVIIAEQPFERDGSVTISPVEGDTSHLKHFAADLFINRDRTQKSESKKLSFYVGPNHYYTLKEQEIGLEDILDLGWFGFITKFLILPIFNWLNSFISNYGLIILLLTIIIKVILFPLTFKSYLSTARMRVLKPQIDELGEKFTKKEDTMKKQQATMDLYKRAGINPMGGCLPMLIQFPILIAMFRFFPASIELRQESFLWAEDLSSFDAIVSWSAQIPLISSIYGNHISLFTLLMAGSMIIVNQFNSANTTTAPGMPNMKVMMLMMSIMMVFWFNSYSSGLSYYYFLANLITIAQTLIIRQMIDDNDILKKIEKNKKKPKKKSNFQARLEKMAREQQKLKK
ncbi:MAG: membrane protein insertase YidC [Bacteroidota bacterium]